MKRFSLTITAYLLLVFACGAAVGAFASRLMNARPVEASRTHPEAWRKQYLQEMETRVHLTSDQVQHLNGILDETRERFHAAREKHDAVMRTIKEEQKSKVRAILSDTQRSEYEKLIAEREARAKAAAGR